LGVLFQEKDNLLPEESEKKNRSMPVVKGEHADSDNALGKRIMWKP